MNIKIKQIEIMTLYHGSYRQIEKADEKRGMYFSTNIEDAKQYALGLDDCGNHNEESFIYSIEIPKNASIVIMDDWMDFDAMGYVNYENTPEFATAEEMEGYFFVKNPDKFDFVLVENFKNEL